MQRSSPPPSISIPGLPPRELPTPELGAAGRFKAVREPVGKAIEGAYGLGAVDGYSIGQSVGYAAGHSLGVAEGVLIGASCTAVAVGIVLFVALTLMKALRR